MTITRTGFHQFLFALCVWVAYSNNYELIFVVWLTACLITLTGSFSVYVTKLIFAFGAVFAIAVVAAFFYPFSAYLFIRDMTYLLKPVLGLLAGYQLLKKIPASKVFPTIITTGLIISAFHMVVIFITLLMIHSLNLNLLREYGGYFSDYEVYVLILLIFGHRFGIHYPKKKLYLYIALVGISTFLYLSRTNFIQFAILLIGIKGYFVVNKRSITIIVSLIVLSVVGYTAISLSNPRRNGKGMEAFLYKIKIAPIEAFKTKIDKENWKDFNDNFRSYETITTIRQVSSEGTRTLLIGKGMGSSIDLGQRILTNDGGYVRHEPIVHNGYMTVLLKSGLLGVFLVLFSIRLMFRNYRSNDPVVEHLNRLMIATGIFLIFSYWVFLGLYFRADSKSVLIGFIIAYIEVLRRNSLGKPQVIDSYSS